MKEVSFIRQNIEKWKTLEKIVGNIADYNPSDIADAYVEISADLSFSRSQYPKSRITLYLNNLASALHNQLHKNKKEKFGRIITFWTKEIPEVMYISRRELLYSFLVFAVSAVIGIISAMGDDSFVRLILGNGYVDMTLENIKNGTPMAVYDSGAEIPMFLMIIINNIRVAFIIYVFGLLTGFGSGYLLFSNGIMVGAFQTFFFQYNTGFESILSIWMHGTFEISAIVVAGCAGFVLGNGWLFPGTYSRAYAFRKAAKRSLKIIVGLIPVFITAGFIESFLTRHTEIPNIIRLMAIILMFACVIYYYIVLPKKLFYGKSKTQN
ncbi:MAG: stage II sporulation protein M [Paludibacter sp.]|jgi:uncharacterized membrane protein SpoIIM required for sporulation|nr:stage II sporulation protein M [Paludibacter sp.]